MASIAMMIGGVVINAAAFTGGNYLARYLSGDGGALAEKTRHDKALEAYEAAQARHSQERTKLLDWIETNRENKAQAKQNFTNTDYAFKLYNQAHPDRKMSLPKEPKFSDFYQPSEAQKQGELLFLPHDKLPRGRKVYKYALTVVDIASRYKEAEPLTSKDSA